MSMPSTTAALCQLDLALVTPNIHSAAELCPNIRVWEAAVVAAVSCFVVQHRWIVLHTRTHSNATHLGE